jgi:lactoylglutathione lyase
MRFAHATIMVKNMEESIKFYQEIVGLPIVKRMPTGPEMELVFLGKEGNTLVELVHNKKNENVSFTQDISLGFEVESMEKMMKFVEDKGIAIHSGPFQPNPNTKFFYILDPNGLKIQFIEH